MQTSNKIALLVLCALMMGVSAGPTLTTEYICNSYQGNVWFEEASKARLLQSSPVPETVPITVEPKTSTTSEPAKPAAEPKANQNQPATDSAPKIDTPVTVPTEVAKTEPVVDKKSTPEPTKPEAKPEDSKAKEPVSDNKETPVPVAPETPTAIPTPAEKPVQKEDKPAVVPQEKKPETPVSEPKKSPYPKAELSVRVKMQSGLPQDAIMAGCVAQLAKQRPVAGPHGSKLYTILGGVVGLMLAVILALSCYYKSHLDKHKQAPFAVPSFLPEFLFPKFDFYYEQEMTSRMRRERLRDEDEI